MRPRARWMKYRKKTDPELPYETPLFLGDKSNGEFYQPQSAKERAIRDHILRVCDDKARKLGMDRREFIASAMGMATSLSVLNLASGCGDKNGHLPMSMADDMMKANRDFMAGQMAMPMSGSGGGGPLNGVRPGGGTMGMKPAGMSGGAANGMSSMGGSGAGGDMMSSMGGAGGSPMMPGGPMDSECAPWCAPRNQPDGGFCIPHEATMNCDMARELIGGDEFIFDMQTHHVNEGQAGFVLSPCELNRMVGHMGDMQYQGNQCAWPEQYIEQIFLDSDTTVAVLSGLPSPTSAQTGDLTGFSNADMAKSRDYVNMKAASQRMVNHCQVGPDANWDAVSAMMEKMQKELGHVGWKSYPPASTGGGPWWLDGPIGERFINRALELGDPLICAHKGFPLPGFDQTYCDPKDVGPAALKFPQATFVIYHSAYDNSVTEGPYDPNGKGVDRLIKTVTDNNLKDKNVYAEMGSAWLLASGDPMTAQHYVGKVLKYIGVKRMLWGSECVWFGCPQKQIEAFRTFTISKEFQDMYGYPELTPEIKAGIFGLTAAKLYCIDPVACRYKVDASILAQLKRNKDAELGDRRWVFDKPAITSRRQFIALAKMRRALGILG